MVATPTDDDGKIEYVTLSRLPICGTYGINFGQSGDMIYVSKLHRSCALNIGDCIVSINNKMVYSDYDHLQNLLNDDDTATLGVIKIKYITVSRPIDDIYGLRIEGNNKIVKFTNNRPYQLRIGDYILFVNNVVLNHKAVIRQFKTKDVLTLGIIRQPS